MSHDRPVLLIDSNVWLDHYSGDRPGSADATALITYADARGLTLAYPASCIKDVYYLIAQSLKRQYRQERGALTEEAARACNECAWESARNLATIAVAVPVGEAEVWLACQLKELHGDLEDDLVLAALESSQADFLVTGDAVLRDKAPRGAFAARDMLAYLRAREG